MKHKKALLTIALCVVIVVGALFTWHFLGPQNMKYTKNIDRSFVSLKEETALTTAESIDYSKIIFLSRFQDSASPDTYKDYVYANFIDSGVLDYYNKRYAAQEEQISSESPKGVTFTYQANATQCSQFQIYNNPAPEGVTWHNITIVKCTPNSSTTYNSGNMQFFYKNQSTYQSTQWNYNFNFNECYVIEMKLHYSEYYGPLAAFASEVYQIVVLDQYLTPVLVGVECQNIVA